ncbi:hypothetical protein GF362_07615 [Candidatus Dojkabacteria bacterium]|nr:hypothetical protein [Candidatus Dojkabacteria bacterium]
MNEQIQQANIQLEQPPIDLFASVEHAHKDMGAEQYISFDAFQQWLNSRGFEVKANPKTAGGFIYDTNTQYVGYIRPPFWRTNKGDPNLMPSDIQEIEPIRERSNNYQKVKSGFELEIFGIKQEKKDGEIMASLFENGLDLEGRINNNNADNEIPIIDFDSKFRALPSNLREIRFGREMAKYTIEINGHPTSNPIKGGLSFLRNQQVLAEIFDDHGWFLCPISAFSHRPFRASDISNDSYLQRIVLNNEMWPREKSLHYVGNSAQFHCEILNEKAGLTALNLYQLVYPLTVGISLASPFMHGKTNPNLKTILVDQAQLGKDKDPNIIKTLDNEGFLSVREGTRFLAGIDSGILHEPFPENPDDYIELVEQKLNSGDIPHPDRGGGQQADRFKFSLHTLEVSNMDTFAGNTLKFLSAQEFSKALMWKLQVYGSNQRGIASLCDRFPSLFKYPVDKTLLDHVRRNALEVTKDGLDAKLVGVDGNLYEAQELFYELLDFVNEPIPELQYYGLPFNVIRELIKSSEIPSQDDFIRYLDEEGLPSVYGYYDSGIGTAAHWLKARANTLVKEFNMPEGDAVENCLIDLGKSYHRHLKQIYGKDIERLFSSYKEP